MVMMILAGTVVFCALCLQFYFYSRKYVKPDKKDSNKE